LRTTSFLVDHDILIDAGTGVGDLEVVELAAIDHIFVTHSHLDHIQSIPLLADTVLGLREKPVIIHATRETTQILKDHIFNWKVWPDFTVIPSGNNPLLVYQEIEVGVTVDLGGRRFTPLPANHVVPAVGFRIDSGDNSLVFTGDTTTCDELWEEVNKIHNLRHLIIETAFSNADLELARLSKHLCPSLLLAELNKMQAKAQIYITHLKPGEGARIMREIQRDVAKYKPTALRNQQVFNL
jgi:ribonuclease BN (tRNA processing enzyme)